MSPALAMKSLPCGCVLTSAPLAIDFCAVHAAAEKVEEERDTLRDRSWEQGQLLLSMQEYAEEHGLTGQEPFHGPLAWERPTLLLEGHGWKGLCFLCQCEVNDSHAMYGPDGRGRYAHKVCLDQHRRMPSDGEYDLLVSRETFAIVTARFRDHNDNRPTYSPFYLTEKTIALSVDELRSFTSESSAFFVWCQAVARRLTAYAAKLAALKLRPGFSFGPPITAKELKVGDAAILEDRQRGTSYVGVSGYPITRLGPVNVRVDTGDSSHRVPRAHVSFVARDKVVHPVLQDGGV